MHCAACGSENPAGARFCENCAAPLVSPHASVERRVVTIMFADVVASTQLSSIVDAERLREQIEAFFGIAREEIERYGGTIEKYIGDAVMAVFGLPIIHENDPELAVQAAQAIRARTRSYVEAGIIPDIRLGVATGEVVANPRAVEKGEFMVTGEVVILAARLQQHGRPGQLLLDESTYAATQHLFEYRRIAKLQVKGKTEPVVAYEYLGPKSRAAPVRRVADIRSPLVGRAPQYASLLKCVEAVLAGRGGIAAIIGDAGMGKSRLVAEVRRHFADRNLLWLEGRALTHSQSISYWPFLEVLRTAAGITETDSVVDSWDKLETLIGSVLPDQLEEVAPYLATVLGIEVPEKWRERVVYLDGEAMGRQLYRSMRLFFERLAQARAVVLVFEDLQWLDESSVALLEHLFPLVRYVPLLLCSLSRPDPSAPAGRLLTLVAGDFADYYAEIRLEPLDAGQSTELIGNLLDTGDLPPHFIEMLRRRAEGNPFFVEEVIRALIHTGALARDATTGRWLLRAEAESLSFPDTIRGVIMARVDRLDEPAKQVLKTASVIGRSFNYRILRAVADNDHLDRSLDELAQMELIRERRRLPELEYAFKHILIQEAVYDSVLLRRRRELHRGIGEAIEALHENRLEESYGVLAYHFARAEDWKKAQDYLFKAGDQAGKMAADAEALAHYERAVEAYTRVFGQTWDPLRRAALDRRVGAALYRRGDNERASQYLQRALGYLGTPFPTSSWDVRLATATQVLRQAGHRLLPWLFLRADRGPVDPRVEERCQIYESLGWIDYFISVERLFLDALMLLNVSERYNYSFGIARGSMGMGLICDLVPAFWLAEHYHRRAVVLAEQIQHPMLLGLTHLGLGFHLLHGRGKWDAALEAFMRSAKAYREAGELRQWGAATQMTIWVSRLRGNVSTGLQLSGELIRVGEETGDPEVLGWGLSERGTCLWMAGNLDDAVSHLRRALELFQGVPDYVNAVVTGSSLGRCHLLQGRLQEALSMLEESSHLVIAKGIIGFDRSQPRVPLAEVYLALAETAEGATRSGWLRKAKTACRAALRQTRADTELTPGALRVRGTYQWLEGRRAAAAHSWQLALAAAERLGARHELGLISQEMGRRLNDRRYLEQAQLIFSEIKAEWDQGQALTSLQKARSSGRSRTGGRVPLDPLTPGGSAHRADRA